MKARLVFFWMLIFSSSYSFSQVIFMELQGSPDMDISGWNLAGAKFYTGDTDGDPDNFNNLFILTNAVNSNGAIFYSESIDLERVTNGTYHGF